MAYSTMEAYEFVCRLDHLRDEIQKQDFAKPVAARVSRVFGLVSRFLTGAFFAMVCAQEEQM